MLNSHLSKPLRVGLVGGGRIGKVHAQSLQRAGAIVAMVRG
jgi:predicted dehydrogenase